MAGHSVDAFDTTLRKTHVWLHEVLRELDREDERDAYSALKATLHALRDRLPIEEVAQLAAQLPMLVRGFYYEGWDPSGKPLKERHLTQFLEHVRQGLRGDLAPEADRVARGVFCVLSRHVSEGEIAQVRNSLPADIRALWV